MTPTEFAFRMKKLKGYGQTLAPKNQRKFEEKMTNLEAKMAAEADRIIENNDKNHSEAMGLLLQIKEGMQQTPLPDQVEMVGTLMKNNTDSLKRMCLQAGVCPKGTKFERAQRLSGLGAEDA